MKLRALILAVALAAGAASLAWPELAVAEASAEQAILDSLLKGYDEVNRGDSSLATVTMNIKTARWERSMTLKISSKGTENALIQVMAPAKDKGQATLKVEDNLWNYLPKVDRTIKLPASMMSSSWMGSHFSNDDLVRESRAQDDFDATLKAQPVDGKGDYVVEMVPKPDAPVVWGKVVLTFDSEHRLPSKSTFYDEKGEAVREITYSDLKEVGGRMMPMRMKMLPLDKDGEYTEIVYEDIKLDIELDDSTFTLQALKP